MSTYVHFTETQREQARQTDLADFLRQRGEKLKRSGSEYEWRDGSEKVTIRGCLWYNQYEREGGDAIDFARRFFDCTYPESVRLLLGSDAGTVCHGETITPPPKPFELLKPNTDMRRVYAYLLKQRCIDREIINYFTHNKMLYEDAEHHNCIFVGYDENGIARHAHKRGSCSGSTFKGNVDSSNPHYSFHHTGMSEWLYVFEAAIDLLSFLSLHPHEWQKHSYVSLCSVASYAAKKMLEVNPNITQVALCLDNDKAGHSACVRIEKELKELHPKLQITHLSPTLKDWNEDLQAMRNPTESEETICQTLQY